MKKIHVIFSSTHYERESGSPINEQTFECKDYTLYQSGLLVKFEEADYFYPWHKIARVKEIK